MNNEILHMWVRIFHAACKKWGKSNVECAEIFDTYKIDDYIRDVYGFFHIQGDEANLSDIEEYLKNKGLIV